MVPLSLSDVAAASTHTSRTTRPEVSRHCMQGGPAILRDRRSGRTNGGSTPPSGPGPPPRSSAQYRPPSIRHAAWVAWLWQHAGGTAAIDCIEATVDVRNVGSWRLLERLAFERVAFIQEADHFKGAVSHEYRCRHKRPPARGRAVS